MDRKTHLLNLRAQYINLSRQYLQELQNGKTIQTLKDLKLAIETLIREIDDMEQQIDRDTTQD